MAWNHRKNLTAWNKGKKIGDRIRKKKLWLEKPCLYCRKGFFSYPSQNRLYCSLSCRSRFNAVVHWHGSVKEYKALHEWVNREFGKPDTCEFCHKDGLYGRSINWANKTDRYLRERSDWLRLCASCHRNYDKEARSSG